MRITRAHKDLCAIGTLLISALRMVPGVEERHAAPDGHDNVFIAVVSRQRRECDTNMLVCPVSLVIKDWERGIF